MNTLEFIEKYSFYKTIGLRIDLCSLGIVISVLIVLLSHLKKDNKDINKAFIYHIICIILLIVSEMFCWQLLFVKDKILRYENFYLINHYMTWLVPCSLFNLVNKIFDYKTHFNKRFYNFYLSLYIIIPLLIFIPSFNSHIIEFNTSVGYATITRLGTYWYALQIFLIMFALFLGALKVNEIGLKDVLVVSIYITANILSIIIDEWWASTISILFISFLLIILIGITYQSRLTVLREKHEKSVIEIKDMKTKLLLNQIQPHFLYNALTTLKYLCETSPLEASELCDNFSDYLRANIDAIEDDGLVPFEKELKNIENYLKIEQARFGDRIKYKFIIETKDFEIPVLSIQTIVENAVKKGICKRKNGGLIIVETKEDHDNYIVSVIDDGVGFDMNEIDDTEKHIGMKNTSSRLELINGTLKVESEIGKGTKVEAYIPKR